MPEWRVDMWASGTGGHLLRTPPPFCSLTCTGTATSPANTCRRGSTAGTGASGAAGMVGCSTGCSGRRRRRCSEEVAQAAVAASSSAKALERATRKTRAIVEAHNECSSSMALQRKGSNEDLQREEGWTRKTGRAANPRAACPGAAAGPGAALQCGYMHANTFKRDCRTSVATAGTCDTNLRVRVQARDNRALV